LLGALCHGLLIKELRVRIGCSVRGGKRNSVRGDISAPMTRDAPLMMDFPCKATYGVFPQPPKSYDDGNEFEERHRA